jgi:hypothetical protein
MQTQTQPKKVGRPKNPYPHVLTPKGFNGWSKAKKREWLLAEIERTKIAKAENLARLVAAKKANKIEFFTKPNPPQQKILEAWLNKEYKTFLFTAGNRAGKTCIGTIIALSTMFGEWPWSKEPIEFPHTQPRRVRLIGTDWEKHIKTVLEPSLQEWWPQSRQLETKKNNVGAIHFWKDVKTGSTLEILSNQSESMVAEGWSGDLVWYDEPVRRDMRIACKRGLVDRRGRELFTATLLGEPWMSRELMRGMTASGTPDPSIFVTTGSSYDNVGFGLTEEGIAEFAKSLTEDEKKVRLFGQPSYMSTLVLPEFNRSVHLKKRFPIPMDWIVTIAIDYHPSTPNAVLFMATEPVGFKWIFHEIYRHGHPKGIAEEIIREIKQNNYRVDSIIIDPLAKGDSNNIETVFDIMNNSFMSAGHVLRVAPKDKEIGITSIRNLLKTQNELPGIFFFDDLKHTIPQVEDWMYDKDTLKPIKENDHMPENLYRLCLLDTRWFPEQEEEDYRDRRYVGRSTFTGY